MPETALAEKSIFTKESQAYRQSQVPQDSGADLAHYSIGYIPALDGLRALSILLVIASHEIGPITSQLGHYYNGWIGVDVFFIISGFLITSILLKESARRGGSNESGKFSLGRFYMRRWLRICPAYYAYLAAVVAWYMWGGDHHLKPFICAGLYLTNLDIAYGWNLIPMKPFLTHLWSLGLEEQFYLVWPACLKFAKKNALKFVASAMALVYVRRLYLVAHGAPWYRLVNGFDTKIDAMLAGVVVALLLSRQPFVHLASKTYGNPIVQLLLGGIMLESFHWIGHPSNGGINDQLFFWAVKMPCTTAIIASFLVSILCGSKGPLARIFANPVPVFIGKLSYSLYLWHPFVHLLYCAFFWNYFCKHGPTAELYQYGYIMAAAMFSYYLIEQPFLKLKSRFS